MAPTSPVLGALYTGDVAGARAAAAGRALDIHEASALGDAERVAELLGGDAGRASAIAEDGFGALHLVAFFSGDARVARALIAAGAPASEPAANEMRVTPLNSAAASGARSVAAVLLEAGADVDAAQAAGYTALHAAAANGDAPLAELLLAHGADPARRAQDGQSPADLADGRGHDALAARLRELAGAT